ncbi:hypothetical protein BVY01_00240 [bacterium I07]|nr:hypothetical protein BVY01_00240 [bacterium I07]
MEEKAFDTGLNDSQGTEVDPVQPGQFDIEAYADYAESLQDRNDEFWRQKEGIAVYRRFRVPRIFSDGCRDMKRSLALQLGALELSMNYEADVPNFLEPWYGIGAAASAFGLRYKWDPNNAPAIDSAIHSVKEALNRDIIPIKKTTIGRHILEMIEYFLLSTEGRIPISLTDTQASLNVASFIMDTNSFYLELFDHPDEMKKLLSIITDLTIEFSQKQQELIGEALVWPGHGFPSSRRFKGIGMSSDVMVTVSDAQYMEFEVPCSQKMGEAFGGAGFHSCGNWSRRIEAVKSIANLTMVDGAFSRETDPDPNSPELFFEQFQETGIVVNVRIVGDPDAILNQVRKLWKPGMRLIVTTYSKTPQEQSLVYNQIQSMTTR